MSSYSRFTKAECYAILKISSTTSTDEVKKAFRGLSLQYHPDKAGSDKAKARQYSELFIDVREAYDVLTGKLAPNYIEDYADEYYRPPNGYQSSGSSSYHHTYDHPRGSNSYQCHERSGYSSDSCTDGYPRRSHSYSSHGANSSSSNRNHSHSTGNYHDDSRRTHTTYSSRNYNHESRSRRDGTRYDDNHRGTRSSSAPRPYAPEDSTRYSEPRRTPSNRHSDHYADDPFRARSDLADDILHIVEQRLANVFLRELRGFDEWLHDNL